MHRLKTGILIAGYSLLIVEFFTPVYYFREDTPSLHLYGFSDVLTYFNVVFVAAAAIVSKYVVKTLAKPLVVLTGFGMLSVLIYSHYFIASEGIQLSMTAFGLEIGDLLLFSIFFLNADRTAPKSHHNLLDKH